MAAEDVRVARARALADKAVLLASVGIPGVDEAEEALAIARQEDDPTLLIRALLARGSVSSFDFELARPYLNEAADLARELGNPWWLARILNWQAIGALQSGDMTATRTAGEEALELAEAIGDKFVSRSCRLWLANAHTYTGDLRGAASLLHQVVGEAASAHDVLVQVIGLVGQSFVDALRGDDVAAQTLADEALDCAARHFPYYDIACYGASLFRGWPRAMPMRRGRRATQRGKPQRASPDMGSIHGLGSSGGLYSVRRSCRRLPDGRRGSFDTGRCLFSRGHSARVVRRGGAWRAGGRGRDATESARASPVASGVT